MNRLILLGNGFDLAHSLKTSYQDFIRWYIKDCFELAFVNNNYEDRLIQISTNPNYIGAALNSSANVEDWVEIYLNEYSKRGLKTRPIFGWGNRGDNTKEAFNVDFKSILLEPLLNNTNGSRWVDIEAEYYLQLKSILRSKEQEKKIDALLGLNTSLAFIIQQLTKYLKNLPSPPFLQGFMNILKSEINPQDLYRAELQEKQRPKDTHILNFNYTNTISQYIREMETYPALSLPVVNFIHGRLESKNDPIIFGFGDELDTAYKEMEEDANVSGYFDYMKSFWYLRTSHYRELVNFLEAGEYQVIILGHSCGISDRTMLKMIFEHHQCKSIKIYYYQSQQSNNFVSLTHEIARHFSDKGQMRCKIVSQSHSECMPQAT